jgi:ribosomal protein S18 acetylase RimI-like enzyme
MPPPDALDPITIAPATWRDFREVLALEHVCFEGDSWSWIDIMAALTFPEAVRLKAVTPRPFLESQIEGGAVPSGTLGAVPSGTLGAVPSGTLSAVPSGTLSAVTPRPAGGEGAQAHALNGSQSIGFVFGDRHRSKGLGWIASIGVHPDYQRHGVGSRLLAACERALATPQVRLTLRPSNTSARRVYNAAGYVEIARLERYYRDGEDGIVMEKLMS